MATTSPTRSRPSDDGPSARVNRKRGDDRPVAKGEDLTVINAIREYHVESKRARWTRTIKNRANQRIFIGEQDYSYKQRGQSKEFIPKLPMAVEQFSGAIKRALTDFGDWFRCEVRDAPLTGEQVRAIVMTYFRNLTDGYVHTNFPVVISDAMKLGAINSLVILKVHGALVTEKRFAVERGVELMAFGGETVGPKVTHTLKHKEVTTWRGWIDLIRDEDYYPDPRGRGLYEIHEIETELAHLIEWAEAGIYDRAAVDRIEEDFFNQEQDILKTRMAGQDWTPAPSFRKRAVIRELWGTILDTKGHTVKKNCLAAVANDKYLIRPPEDNPNWHGESDFVVFPLLRVPHSVWHKALADHGSSLNMAMNELFNLMLDGGLARVWGTRQIHTDWLEDPRQVSDGIPQGTTLQVNDRCPPGQKAMEVVATGEVPPESLAMYNLMDREFNAGMMVNDTKLGLLPPKQVKATEIVASEQGSASLIDGIDRDIEGGIEQVIRKFWLNLLQHADDLDSDDIVGAVGVQGAIALARMSSAERFAAFHGAKFAVFGLSAVRSRVRDFQKLAALLQLVSTQPMLMQAFVKKYSIDATLDQILKTLNIDPAALQLTPEERQALPQMMQAAQQMQALMGQSQGQTQGGAGMSAQNVGEPGLPAEINQQRTNALAAAGV